MDTKRLLTSAAVTAACLWPVAGAWAQAPSGDMSTSQTTVTTTATSTSDTVDMSGTIMDAGRFRDSLHQLRDDLNRLRENRRLALAAQDPMVAGQFQEQNKNVLEDTLGLLDTITRNWRRSEIRAVPGQTAEMSGRSGNEFGAADMQRFANESEDTAFVRNAVWDIQSRLEADKLNGRPPVVNRAMMAELDAAITRAENPDFRVARSLDYSRLNEAIVFPEHKPFVWDRSHDMTAQAPTTTESTTTEETTATTTPAPAPVQTAENPTPAPETSTEETTTSEERTGAANLPQTGGDPGMFLLIGSTLIGLGGAFRRRRAS